MSVEDLEEGDGLLAGEGDLHGDGGLCAALLSYELCVHEGEGADVIEEHGGGLYAGDDVDGAPRVEDGDVCGAEVA